ncbi:MAG: TolC family protein [Nevskia sp.]
MLLRIRGAQPLPLLALWLLLSFPPGFARADESYAAETGGPPLSLADTRRLALERQPSLLAQAAAVEAARASAVAAAQLPDPKLKGGVSDLTITGRDIGTLTRESDTQFNIGIAQDFPRGDKLKLRGRRAQAEAELADRQLQLQRLALERDIGLAWIEVWKPQRALALARAAEREAALQLDNAKIAYANGKTAQADVRTASVTLALMRDDIAKLEQDTAHARSLLSRWIGEAAYRPLPEQLPAWPEPAPLAELLVSLRQHPHVGIAARQVDVAEASVALAKQAYKPDWSVELGYALRPNYADYVNLQVGIDLPVFTANRQDRELAARRAELERAEQLKEDDYREHAAEARLNYGDWTLLAGRLARFDDSILPEAQARIDAARLAWSSGSGTLAAVLDARRAALDARLRRLDLESDRAKHAIALRYLGATADGEQP